MRPTTGWSGVLTLQGLGVAGNLFAGVISAVSGPAAWVLGLWALSILLLLWGIYLVRQRARKLVLVPKAQQPAKHKGLIVLVGTGRPGEDPMSQSAGIAIDYHASPYQGQGLRVCWLIASGGERGSLPVAQQLEQECLKRHVTPHIHTVADEFSVQEAHDLVQRIYAQELPTAGLLESEVISDFTGGTKPMSAGMILACGDRRPMQYMYGRKEGIASVPRLVEFAPGGPAAP